MTSFDPSSDELVSAYLDGEATDAERARVESDPELRSRVETFRLVSSAVATPPPMPDAAARDAAIAAALAASNTTANVTSLAPVQERRSRFSGAKTGVLSAAAVILVLFLGVAIIGNLGGDDAQDTATVADASSDDAADFDGGDDGEGDDAASSATGSFSGDDITESADLDEEASEEEAMEDEAEAMEEAMEDEEAMEEEAMADDEETAADDSGDAADGSTRVAPRTFVSLNELTDVYTTEENTQERAFAEFLPEVIEMADLCRQEPNDFDTNSLVFLEPAILLDADQAQIEVLVYRDDVIDADPFIRVFEFGTCAPIQ